MYNYKVKLISEAEHQTNMRLHNAAVTVIKMSREEASMHDTLPRVIHFLRELVKREIVQIALSQHELETKDNG